MKKKKKRNSNERALKQHSALTTFTTEQEYFNIDTEKALFSILSDSQIELQRLFVEVYKPYLKKLFKDEEVINKILENVYNTNKISYKDIDFSKMITKEIPNLSKEVIRKKIEAAHSALIDKSKKEKYLLDIEGIDIKLLNYKEKNEEDKLIYSKEELINLLDDIKDICKYETLRKYGRSKIIDFTAFTNKLGVNSKRLKDNIDKASKVQLKFNYINKKKLQIEAVSNLISTIIFITNKKSTWMKYEIPEEVLKHLLMPDVYVYLPERNIHKLEGKYSIRLYTFLKDHLSFGHVTITKEECQNFLKLPKSYMANKYSFVNKFLNPTIADIQAKTLLMIDYELIPQYNFKEIKFTFKEGKEEVIDVKPKESNTFDALEIVEISEELQEVINKAKRNIYVARAWNKRVNTKIIKMIKEEGEDFAREILKDLYKNLNENIKTTLVQYINGIIRNKKLAENYKEEKKKKEIQKEIEKNKSDAENDEIGLQKVASEGQEKLLNTFTEYESEKLELQKVVSNKDEEIELQKVVSEKSDEIELQKVVSEEEEEETLYDKCLREKRLKTQEKFIITYEEYMKEHKKYIKKGYTSIKATTMMNQMFVVRSEEE